MGALCAGPNKNSEAFNVNNVKLTKDEHGHFNT